MDFCDLAETGTIPEFDGVVRALRDWGDEIIAFHHPKARRISNGRLDGTKLFEPSGRGDRSRADVKLEVKVRVFHPVGPVELERHLYQAPGAGVRGQEGRAEFGGRRPRGATSKGRSADETQLHRLSDRMLGQSP